MGAVSPMGPSHTDVQSAVARAHMQGAVCGVRRVVRSGQGQQGLCSLFWQYGQDNLRISALPVKSQSSQHWAQ